jgi:hypothetical protein
LRGTELVVAMTKHNAIRTALLAALVACSFVGVPAAGPFQVRRATTGAGVVGAPPVATIATAPYDGESLAAGGVNYYYGVFDASGTALDISAQAIKATQTIRIGFDDGNPTSAPVNANASSVAVSPASIVADGIQFSVITVVPTDANGVLLGRGLSITIDPALLWPAHLTGGITDLGTGTYVATAVSSIAGTGTVRVVVEGVSLSSMPMITANPVDPSGSLRDLAIQQLTGLTGAGGPLARLAAEAAPGTEQASSIAAARNSANLALSNLVNNSSSQDANVLTGSLEAAVAHLMDVEAHPGSVDALDVRDALDDLMGVARLVALWHIQGAESACGVCNGSANSSNVCGADSQLATGDTLRGASSPNWTAIIEHYASATQLADQATQSC